MHHSACLSSALGAAFYCLPHANLMNSPEAHAARRTPGMLTAASAQHRPSHADAAAGRRMTRARRQAHSRSPYWRKNATTAIAPTSCSANVASCSSGENDGEEGGRGSAVQGGVDGALTARSRSDAVAAFCASHKSSYTRRDAKLSDGCAACCSRMQRAFAMLCSSSQACFTATSPGGA
jgi:hypothetical protein